MDFLTSPLNFSGLFFVLYLGFGIDSGCNECGSAQGPVSRSVLKDYALIKTIILSIIVQWLHTT